MSKVRINDLARELEVKSKAILDVLPIVGVTEKKTHSSSLEEHEAEKVRVHLRGSSEAAAPAAKSARPLRGEEEIKTKIDLSHISRPGDVLKAITQKKAEVAPPPRPPAPPVVSKPVVVPPAPRPVPPAPPVTVVPPAKPSVIVPEKPVVAPLAAPPPRIPAPPAVVVAPPVSAPAVPTPPITPVPVVSAAPAAPTPAAPVPPAPRMIVPQTGPRPCTRRRRRDRVRQSDKARLLRRARPALLPGALSLASLFFSAPVPQVRVLGRRVRRFARANADRCIPRVRLPLVLGRLVWDRGCRLRDRCVPAVAPVPQPAGRASATFRAA
jgi:Translation initiation factor IF-2, N-terminal region